MPKNLLVLYDPLFKCYQQFHHHSHVHRRPLPGRKLNQRPHWTTKKERHHCRLLRKTPIAEGYYKQSSYLCVKVGWFRVERGLCIREKNHRRRAAWMIVFVFSLLMNLNLQIYKAYLNEEGFKSIQNRVHHRSRRNAVQSKVPVQSEDDLEEK